MELNRLLEIASEQEMCIFCADSDNGVCSSCDKAKGIGLDELRKYYAAVRNALRRAAEDDKALPCKAGDTLYEVDVPEYGVITCKVLWINYYNGPEFHRPGNGIVSVWSIHVEVIDGHGKGSTYDFEQGDIGKTVFLTRQEAEAALEKGEQHG